MGLHVQVEDTLLKIDFGKEGKKWKKSAEFSS